MSYDYTRDSNRYGSSSDNPRSDPRFDDGSDPRGSDPSQDGESLAGAIGWLSADDPSPSPSIDPLAEESYWREHFYTRPYVRPGDSWSDFGAAFRLGWQARRRYPLHEWREIEERLARLWRDRDPTAISWERARRAARDAWDHATSWFDDRDEDAYWQARISDSATPSGERYDTHRAAYRFGWEAKRRHVGLTWAEAEPTVESEWHALEMDRRLPWSAARGAIRDAWLRVERMLRDGTG